MGPGCPLVPAATVAPMEGPTDEPHQPVDLEHALAGLAFLVDPATTPPLGAAEDSFRELGQLGDRGLFVSTFSGNTPWERHHADELLLILDGHDPPQAQPSVNSAQTARTLSTVSVMASPSRIDS